LALPAATGPAVHAEFVRHGDVAGSIQVPLPMQQQAIISAAELQRLTEQAGVE
jgi:hypothetical protein